MSAPNRTLKQRAYSELNEYLAISFYLWIVFASLVLYKSVVLSENQIPFAAHGLALLNALALGKVMLIAQDLHFADYFKQAPLIYPTIFKSGAFAIVLGFFKTLEEALIGLYHGRSFNASIAEIGGGTLHGILSLMLILGILLIPFFGIAELGAVLGKDKIRKLFFSSRHSGHDGA